MLPGVLVIAIAASGAVIAVSFTGMAWAVVHYKEAETWAPRTQLALSRRPPT